MGASYPTAYRAGSSKYQRPDLKVAGFQAPANPSQIQLADSEAVRLIKEAMLKDVRSRFQKWENLPPVERARLVLPIARLGTIGKAISLGIQAYQSTNSGDSGDPIPIDRPVTTYTIPIGTDPNSLDWVGSGWTPSYPYDYAIALQIVGDIDIRGIGVLGANSHLQDWSLPTPQDGMWTAAPMVTGKSSVVTAGGMSNQTGDPLWPDIWTAAGTWTRGVGVPLPGGLDSSTVMQPGFIPAPDTAPQGRVRFDELPRPRELDADLVPGYRDEWGPLPDRIKLPVLPFDVVPGAPRPSLEPPFVITEPGTAPQVGHAPGTRPRPATEGTKERKVIGNVHSRGLLGLLVNGVTESLDAVDAIWEALPEKYQTGYYWSKKKGAYVKVAKVSAKTKLKDLYRHYDQIDVNEALRNLLEQQLQDAAFGRLGALAQKEARPILERLGRPFGFQTGPAI